MVKNSTTNTHYTCSQCGSELIFVSQEKIQPEGSRYPQINTVYRCSNDECQKKKDREKKDRQAMREKREVTEKERTERNQELRKLGRKLKQP